VTAAALVAPAAGAAGATAGGDTAATAGVALDDGGAAFAIGEAAGAAGAGFTTAGGTTAADLGGDGRLRPGRNTNPAQPAKATADIHVDNRLSVLSTDVSDAMRTCWSNAAKALRSPLSHIICR
jgi:hypothetical protein